MCVVGVGGRETRKGRKRERDICGGGGTESDTEDKRQVESQKHTHRAHFWCYWLCRLPLRIEPGDALGVPQRHLDY